MNQVFFGPALTLVFLSNTIYPMLFHAVLLTSALSSSPPNMTLQCLSAPTESEILACQRHHVGICSALGKGLQHDYPAMEALFVEGRTLERGEPWRRLVVSR